MPGSRRAEVAIDDSLCRRCQTQQPALIVRNEPLCAACFTIYVSTKVVKRMESFRVRHSDPGKERTLLLPLSYGPCSTALLHVLDQHLKGQAEKTGRTGFKLHILHVHNDGEDEDIAIADEVRARYPDHLFSSCPLSDVLSLHAVTELFPESARLVGGQPKINRLAALMESLGNPTSRADVAQILLAKLVVSFAKQHDCEATIWGDSTTRLAERTLAETAKGRGASLPWIVADGEPLHGLPFYHPMRDLLTKEIAAFTSFVDPPLDDIMRREESTATLSSKKTTIDDLMKQYFESVEREYPSIVANVVKTTSKLYATPMQQIEQQCELCDAPLDGQAPERSRLCYGCIRTLS